MAPQRARDFFNPVAMGGSGRVRIGGADGRETEGQSIGGARGGRRDAHRPYAAAGRRDSTRRRRGGGLSALHLRTFSPGMFSCDNFGQAETPGTLGMIPAFEQDPLTAFIIPAPRQLSEG